MLRDLLASVRDRFADLDALTSTAFEGYERVPDRMAVVRTNEVAKYVAARQGAQVGPHFRAEMLSAMRRAGLMTVKRASVRYYRGLRKRG